MARPASTHGSRTIASLADPPIYSNKLAQTIISASRLQLGDQRRCRKRGPMVDELRGRLGEGSTGGARRALRTWRTIM
jgi:hypothetical protein